MDQIRVWSKCEKCTHAKVCNYSKSCKELIETMNKQLETWCGTDYFLPDFFEFGFECREYSSNSANSKPTLRGRE